MVKSREIKGSLGLGFLMGFGSYWIGFGLIGSMIIGALAIIGKSVGFHFNKWKLVAGHLIGAMLAIVGKYLITRSIERAFMDSAGAGNTKKTVDMVWDPVSKMFVMK